MAFNNKRKQTGYTLIELLLVLVVISLIAALGVKTYRDKAASDRANIAALTIQHVLESGISYNVANKGQWPKINWNPCQANAAVADQDFVQNYLPNNSNQSNYGTALCWSGDDPSLGPQKAVRFWVALKTGNDLAATQAATRIAARLPNAVVTSDPTVAASTNGCPSGQPCYVKAMVSMPSVSNTGNKTYFAGAGNCDSNIPHGANQPGSGVGVSCQRTTLANQFPEQAPGDTDIDSLSQYEIDFQCSPGEVPNIYVTPNFVRMDRFNGTSGSTTTQVEPMYQLSGAPENISGGYNPPYYSDYHLYCPSSTPADGIVKCNVVMVATYDGQNTGPVDTVGCTSHMQNDLHVCNCMAVTDNGRRGGCADRPGAIGASYVAVCNPPLTELKVVQTDKNNW